jgi:hypothetical protein
MVRRAAPSNGGWPPSVAKHMHIVLTQLQVFVTCILQLFVIFVFVTYPTLERAKQSWEECKSSVL